MYTKEYSKAKETGHLVNSCSREKGNVQSKQNCFKRVVTKQLAPRPPFQPLGKCHSPLREKNRVVNCRDFSKSNSGAGDTRYNQRLWDLLAAR
jgi:hypothetical protein